MGTVLFVPGVYIEQHTMRCLIRYDLDTKQQKVLELGQEDARSWFVGSTGDIIADDRYDQETGRWSMRVAQGRKLVEIASGREGIDVPSIIGFGPGDGTLLTQFLESGRYVWTELSLRNGVFGPSRKEGTTRSEPIEDMHTQRMIGGVRVQDEDQYVIFDAERQRLWDSIV